jgi:hypothetical protein
MIPACASCLAVVTLAASCGGKSLDIGYDDDAIRRFSPDAPVDMSAVRARCAAAGTDAPFTFDVAPSEQLAGRWFLCEAQGGVGLPAAFELTADGKWYALDATDSGVYVRDATHQGEYSTIKYLSCCYPDSLVLILAASSDAEPRYYATFKKGPRQLLLANGDSRGADPRPIIARFVGG